MPANPCRPRLPELVEAKFSAVDRRSAMAYRLLEDNSALMDDLLAEGVVWGEIEMTDSLVHEIDEVKSVTASDDKSAHAGRAVVADKDGDG